MKLADAFYAYPWTQFAVNNCNAFLLGSGPRALIDPGHDQLYGHVETGLAQDGITGLPELVILTHCHPDHMESALRLQKAGCKLAMHKDEAVYMEGDGRRLAAALGMNFPEVQMDILLEEGEIKVGDESLWIYHTPGHSPGHICIHWPRYKALFAGDLIFAQGVGRVDFPGGSGEELKDSIRRMSELDLEIILPGHGPIIKGKENIERNFEVIEQMYFGMI